MNYNTELQSNNVDLRAILKLIKAIKVSTVYVSENEVEPDAAIGKDGDLWLIMGVDA